VPKRLPTTALVVYAFALALGLGASSAYLAISGEFPLGAVQAGPWKAWPQVGSREADPYARSIIVREAEIPLGTGEGLVLAAATDGTGRALDSGCTYRIGTTTPQARLWTLTVYDESGNLVSTPLERSGFTSAEILRGADGGFTVTLARDLQPGNWLKLPPVGSFSLMLRLYDSPVAAGSASLNAATLPAIERVECGA
jgi:hypothetical protein